jgi:predicted HTH transcriptional regulator
LTEELCRLVAQLCALPHETEWVEFKLNNDNPDDIGQYVSAISNSCALLDRDVGYVVWGVDAQTHELHGTTFRPRRQRVGNEELENWLSVHLHPRPNFTFHEITCDGKRVVLLEVPAAFHTPIRFDDISYVRVGSYRKLLRDHPEKERSLWIALSRTSFETQSAEREVTLEEILARIDYAAYFNLSGQPLPGEASAIASRLVAERVFRITDSGRFDITNLGAVLFGRRLGLFSGLGRKTVRVIVYRGMSRVETLHEREFLGGYAAEFEELVAYINAQLPRNEHIGQALRSEVKMYPEIAVRELVANALIHQDFTIGGTGPMVEIFDDRVEITNPGTPLIDTQRFIDLPPQSRNDLIASLMRRLNVCEERGSGIDKVIFYVEVYQLPAPEFSVSDQHTKAVLFSYRAFAKMSKADRIRACYQHAALQFVSNQAMTNASLRKRFSISDANYATASRVIADTIEAGLIKPNDPENRSRKHASYVPFWA